MQGKSKGVIRDRIVGLRRVRAGELLENPRNWRQHPQAQQNALKGVLAEIGYASALLARETPDGLLLIDGHLRASLDPDQEVPVLVLDLNEEEANKLLATLDPLAAMAYTDVETFGQLVSDMSFEAPELMGMLESISGGRFQPLDIAGDKTQAGLTDPDDVPEVPAESWVKRGDVFQLGEHRLMCGDATQDIPTLLDGQKPELLLTDPPYGINIVKVKGGNTQGGNGSDHPKVAPFGRVRQPGGKPSGILGSTYNASSSARLSKLPGRVHQPGGRQIVQPHLYPVITGDDKPFDPAHLLALCPTTIIFGANHFASRLPDTAGWIVWDKGISIETSFSGAELAWTNRQGHLRMYRHTWSGLVRQGSRDLESIRRLHPTQKPVGLLEQIMGDFSNIGDSVCDPYLGSGSTLIASTHTNRILFGMEIEPCYVQVSLERWEAYTGRKAERVE